MTLRASRQPLGEQGGQFPGGLPARLRTRMKIRVESGMLEVVIFTGNNCGQRKQVRQAASGVMKDQIKFKHKRQQAQRFKFASICQQLILACALVLACACSSFSSQQMLMFSSRGNERQTAAPTSQRRIANQVISSLQVPSNNNNNNNKQLLIATSTQNHHHQGGGGLVSSSSALANQMPWRSHHHQTSSPILSTYQPFEPPASHSEPRGALTRNLYSRGARNASHSSGSGGGGGGSWHFPRISPEQAAEVLLTGAQVINRIAQADTPLNYCRTPDNQDGECSDIRKCIWLVLDKARLKQSVCLRNLIIPAVCCPVSNANNTPIANMIQSTLEPVLFRPGKGNKHGEGAGGSSSSKYKPSSSSSSPVKQQQQQQVEIEPPVVSSSTSRPPVASTPPASLVIKNPSSPQASSTTSTTTTTTTTSTTSTTESPIHSSTSGPANQLFQDVEESQVHQSGTKVNAAYNRTTSQKYPWANETCGEGGRARTGRIVGGSDSKLGQWPWMTAMYLNKRSSALLSGSSGTGSGSTGAGEFWCGGALINRRFILTAAHCLSDQRGNRYKNDQVTIKLGGVDLVRHQAPADILRNAELGGSQSDASIARASGQPQQFFSTHLDRDLKPARRSTSAASSRNSYRSDGDDEEFSWTSFITKALGLGGGGGSSSSHSSSSTSGPNTSPWSSSSASGAGASASASKALDSQKKQQLAAHARKTYFKEYRVANIKQHPKFQRHGFYNDIGLIELKSDVDYDDLVAPICLPTEHDLKRDLTGYMATVLGWGTLSYGGQGSKLLQQVAMPVWSNKDCDERYLQHIGKTFLCAGFLTGGKDACQGDSGGPLMVGDQTGRWTLHGVVSFGKTCAQAGYPGVYTRVTEYLDWIRDNTDLEGYHHTRSTSNGAKTGTGS